MLLTPAQRSLLLDGLVEGRPAVFDHGLDGRPELTLGVAVELAGRVPEAWTMVTAEHGTGACSTGTSDELRAVAEGLASGDRMLRLMHVNNLAPVSTVTKEVHTLLRELAELAGDPVVRVDASLFASSPRGVTLPHVDLHHNVLLVLEGTKTVQAGWFPEHLRVVERSLGCARYLDRMPEVQTWELSAGQGIYFPPHIAHTVLNGPQVNLALSCSWSTAVSDRQAGALQTNRRLRRLGLSPRPVGSGAGRDRVKAGLDGAVSRVRAASGA